MSGLKGGLGAALVPLLRSTHELRRRLRNLGAHAQLAAALQAPVPASVVILGAAEVYGTGAITLGRELLLFPRLYLETQGSGSIAIGDGCVLSTGVHVVSMASIRIGRGSMIGEYASLRDANHVRVPWTPLRDAGHRAQPIVLGEEVWIGRGAVVLGGVTIGDGATVGANAVVTRDVPAGMTVVGVPARPIQPRSPQAKAE